MVSAEEWVSSGSIEQQRIEPLRLEPPPYYIARPQIVDRVAYLQELLAERQRVAAMADAQREAFANALRQRLTQIPEAVDPVVRAGMAQAEAERRRGEEELAIRRQQRQFYSGATGEGGGPSLADIATGAVRAARRIPDLPLGLTAVSPTGQLQTGSIRESEIPPELREPVIGAFGKAVGASVLGGPLVSPEQREQQAEVAADVALPRYTFEFALEFAPQFGTADDLMRAFRANAPEAVRAVRQAMDSPQVQRIGRALGSERGALKVGEEGERAVAAPLRPMYKKLPVNTGDPEVDALLNAVTTEDIGKRNTIQNIV